MAASKEAAMNMPLLIAAVCTGLPGCAAGQAFSEPGAAASTTQCAVQEEKPRAASALPARAATHSEPQRGSIAATGRIPSYADTPSARAMSAAKARAEAAGHSKNRAQATCADQVVPHAHENGRAGIKGS